MRLRGVGVCTTARNRSCRNSRVETEGRLVTTGGESRRCGRSEDPAGERRKTSILRAILGAVTGGTARGSRAGGESRGAGEMVGRRGSCGATGGGDGTGGKGDPVEVGGGGGGRRGGRGGGAGRVMSGGLRVRPPGLHRRLKNRYNLIFNPTTQELGAKWVAVGRTCTRERVVEVSGSVAPSIGVRNVWLPSLISLDLNTLPMRTEALSWGDGVELHISTEGHRFGSQTNFVLGRRMGRSVHNFER